MTQGQGLREGFSSGTCACAAALAALRKLCAFTDSGLVSVPLPPFESASDGTTKPRAWMEIPLETSAYGLAPDLLMAQKCGPEQWLSERIAQSSAQAYAVVCKDGGDDPDVTNGALISASILRFDTPPEGLLNASAFVQDSARQLCLGLEIEGGPGIGRVTLPGLGLAPGQAAINPVPRAQIHFALEQELGRIQELTKPAQTNPFWLSLIISVKNGAEMAGKTMNPRLGIIGGISILGTQGTVRPFSNDAWRKSIVQGMEVARALGARHLCLSSGRRSERLLQGLYPDLAPQAFIQAADFIQFSLQSAGKLPFENIVWGSFFAKLLKLAQGHANSHASQSCLDFISLAKLGEELGLACTSEIAGSLTAAQALEYILDDARGNRLLEHILDQAAEKAAEFAGRAVKVHLFHIDGRELGQK